MKKQTKKTKEIKACNLCNWLNPYHHCVYKGKCVNNDKFLPRIVLSDLQKIEKTFKEIGVKYTKDKTSRPGVTCIEIYCTLFDKKGKLILNQI